MFGCIRFRKAEEERFALRNGDLILEHLINSFNGECNPFRIFSKDELTTATNNYKTKILHEGTRTSYQGSHEGREICVKKYPFRLRPHGQLPFGGNYVEWDVNEVAVASQLSKHKHVLKFLGCCLETPVITLVFEFAANGTLHHHLFGVLSPLSWHTRLRIATEIAEAVAYLHEGASKAIIHRAIMPRNIFLDQDLVVKLFEFGLSLLVPPGEEHVDAGVTVGTLVFIAPESYSTLRFTEKSDVYSFGVVLFEIFTGKQAYRLHDALGSEEDSTNSTAGTGRGAILRASNCNRDNDIESYIRNAMTMSDQGNNKQRIQCAELTRRCLSLSPDQRPTVKEAAKKLKQIRLLD